MTICHILCPWLAWGTIKSIINTQSSPRNYLDSTLGLPNFSSSCSIGLLDTLAATMTGYLFICLFIYLWVLSRVWFLVTFVYHYYWFFFFKVCIEYRFSPPLAYSTQLCILALKLFLKACILLLRGVFQSWKMYFFDWGILLRFTLIISN